MSIKKPMKLSLNQLKKLVIEKISLTQALYKLNPDGDYSLGRNCFCPFHENTDTPAASLYEDDNQETLYCFTERRSYNSFDALQILLNENGYEIGEAIWNKMSELEQQSWLSEHMEVDYESEFNISEEEEEISEELDINLELAKKNFKSREITVEEFLDSYFKK